MERMSSFTRTGVLICALTILSVASGCGSVFVAPFPSSHGGAGGEGGFSTTASSTSGASSAAGGASPGGTTVWSRRFGGDFEESLEGFAVSPAGNIALVGTYQALVDFGGGPLPKADNAWGNIFIVGLDAAGEHVFSHALDGLSDPGSYKISRRDVAFDSQGNIIVAGALAGDIAFVGCATLGGVSGDVFVAKLGPTGECLWSKRFPGEKFKRSLRVAVAPSGEIVVGGIFFGKIDFGGEVLWAFSKDQMDDGRLFLARFDGEGNPLWSKKFGVSPVLDVHLAVDEAGSVLVGGGFKGTIDFGGGPLSNDAGEDIYLARLDPAGNHLWSKRLGGNGDDVATSVAPGPGGALVVAGRFDKTIDFGGGVISSAGSYTRFLAGFDAEGKHAFSRAFLGGVWGGSPQLATRQTGQIALAGELTGSLGLGGTPLLAQGSSGDVFAARYDAFGHFVWGHGFKCAICQGILTVAPAFDADGNVFLAGAFRSTLDLGQPPLVSASPRSDIFVAKLSP